MVLELTILYFKTNERNTKKQIVSALSVQLESKYGRNFEEKNLRRMMPLAEQFTDKEIVVTLSRQLCWSHFLAIIAIKNLKAKLFYSNQVNDQLMSVSDLRKETAAKTFERTEIANIQIPIVAIPVLL
ncbi:DUF1016 N-terminal domain-containing protein [Flavobacterium sp. LS1R47]|uniref:DUF1016 N-terminal domain-containing protein n=1 Tax=Flavobacterium frigoritolerans TaxID=2987686 RepID=A0A9X3CAP8_9FLAO|nr:DUF1016 N-terminal domain-containing protein [Flavobacterium frigoritolerans]MCV9934647.1 DUF1016 N-terminal domain-containing protein [Flavobacterium frigoritolerans]